MEWKTELVYPPEARDSEETSLSGILRTAYMKHEEYIAWRKSFDAQSQPEER